MLFNAFPFLLVFLPAALLLNGAVERLRPGWRLGLLVGLSVVFYAQWDIRFVPLLAGSILVNWGCAELFLARGRGLVIALALAADLLLLGLFKYLGFVAGFVPGLDPGPLQLPLGISFFTFHHVMYLVDLKAGRAPRLSLTRYALYIAFFPQVLAGPLVRWSEMVPQFDARPAMRPDAAERAGRGAMLIVIGLAKKVLLGDPLAAAVNPVFAHVSAGQPAGLAEAWQAVLGFTFQIYFDFSGYTDIALGLGLLFGFVLPQNFAVPYRAASLQEFWRRWHMTLSRFLRDYLYVPLGGSRAGLPVQLGALTVTMALGGLWHGASLTFVAWGLAHGLCLGAGVLWRRTGRALPPLCGPVLTFAAVTLLWVLFRAPSFEAAASIYRSLAGWAPAGPAPKWLGLAVPAAVAMIGPTTWDAVHRVRPGGWTAAAFAVLAVVVLFKIGDNETYEFIYFQF